jgi:hypothetical protein
MSNRQVTVISLVSFFVAIGGVVFSLGYFKANIDRLMKQTDLREEQLRVEQIVDKALDRRLQTIIDKFSAKTSSSLPEASKGGSSQQLPLAVLQIQTPQDKAIIDSIIIEVSGTHSMPLTAHIWILLSDSYGNFYLQNPPVMLRRDGTWIATNIRPGPGIIAIHAIYIDTEENEIFRGKARNNQWGGFTDLPPSARVLDTVNIARR